MLKPFLLFLSLVSVTFGQSQNNFFHEKNPQQDSIKKSEFLKSIGAGYFPTRFLNVDLRYLIKYNQFEGIRTGLGGSTNDKFSKKYKLNAYAVYGIKDTRLKYSFGGGFRISEKTNSWINLSYTDDLEETGSTEFITDGRNFQFFEPRLLNINLFHRHVTKSLSIEHQITSKILAEAKFMVSNIHPTYQYSYLLNDVPISSFQLSIGKIALQWNPFNITSPSAKNNKIAQEGYPKFTLQYSKNFNKVFKSNFGFSKIDFRTLYKFGDLQNAFTEITLVSGIANGNTPLTHLYHAYPNNISKETVLQRFSVAGLNGFETMYFNEFFSDKFATLQLKHYVKPFDITERYKPQLVLITRYAIGDMENPEKHQNVTFNSLKKGYTESGFEINKLLFGFGFSFTYRYGAYHLPRIDDNVAFKFTFNVSL